MPGPAWLAGAFAVSMLLVALAAASRLVAVGGRRARADVDVAEVVMGVAMAGMFLPALEVVPRGAAQPIFAGATVWFAGRFLLACLGRGQRGPDTGVSAAGHDATHAVMFAAMFVVGLSGASPTSTMAMGSARAFTGSPLVLLLALIGSSVIHVDGADSRRRRARASTSGVVLLAVSGGGGSPEPVPPGPRDDCLAAGRDGRSQFVPAASVGAHLMMCIATGYMLFALI